MAIEYTLLLKDKRLSEEILIKKIETMGYSCNKFEQLAEGISIDLNEEIGFSVILFDSGEYPYNSWESIFLENDFISETTLEFRMVKEYREIEKRYNTMLKIVFDLAIELNEDAILTSNGDTELCFFRANRAVLLNNESGIWSRNCFRDIIMDRDVCYFKSGNHE